MARIEDRPREPVYVQKPPISLASQTAPRRAAVAREPATEQHMDSSLVESPRSKNDTPGDTVATQKCEPGWGENLGIFKPSLHSKAGRIEKVPSDMPITSDGSLNITGDETILWINNRCYTIIVSLDPQRRGMYRCVAPLGKTAARGDLFDHMNESQPPQSHDTDDPWISYGITVGASRDRHNAP